MLDDNTFSTILISANTTSFIQRFTVLSAYAEDYEFAMFAGWDGADVVVLAPEVLALAERSIGGYATTDHLIEVTPGKDGSLSFVWDDDQGNYIYLDVGPGDTVHLYHDLVRGPKWEGVSVASDRRILDKLTRAFKETGWPLHQLVVVSVPSSNASNLFSLEPA
jgi:hypothetical protein